MNDRTERARWFLVRARIVAAAVAGALVQSACNTCHAGDEHRDAAPVASPGATLGLKDAVANADRPLEVPVAAPDAPKPPLRVGDTATLRDFAITVVEVKTCEVPAYLRAKAGHVKLGVLVQIEGRSKQEVPVNVFYAKLIHRADGNKYLPVLGGCTPELASSRVVEGQVARGWITFEIPETVGASDFTFSPFIISSPTAQEASFHVQR